MRVYGSSPLYNYVELIFRSKRLFIVSVVLATIATVTFAIARAKTYTASALVLLSGSSPGVSEPTEGQRGTIKFKLNVLNVVLKDPVFMAEAFREGGLNRNRSEAEFEEFSKQARKAITFASGQNILEITCKWRNAEEAEKIIQAFYSAYARRVLDEETVVSQGERRLVQKMLDDYTIKERALEKRVVAYKQQHATKVLLTPEAAAARYESASNQVKNFEAQIRMVQRRLATVTSQLNNTPKTIEERRTTAGAKMDPLYQSLQARKNELDVRLADLRVRYNDTHPQVKQVLDQLSEIDTRMKALEKSGTTTKEQGPLLKVEQSLNPDWQTLSSNKMELEQMLAGMQSQLQNAKITLENMKNESILTPVEQYNFKWMVKDLDMYSAIRKNLSAKLEAAQMEEKRDRELRMAEMKMVVEPKAEPDITGAKSLIFFAMGPILGLLIAFGFSLLAESLDHSLRTPVEVEKYLGKPVLAVLPQMETPKEARRRLAGGGGSDRTSLPSS